LKTSVHLVFTGVVVFLKNTLKKEKTIKKKKGVFNKLNKKP
jgi:hypothetical protein